AHYDYWSDTVRKSILLDAKADLVVHGMGEEIIVEIAKRLAAGKSVKDLRDLRGVAYVLGASEAPMAPFSAKPKAPAEESTRIRDNTSADACGLPLNGTTPRHAPEGFVDLSHMAAERRKS